MSLENAKYCGYCGGVCVGTQKEFMNHLNECEIESANELNGDPDGDPDGTPA